MQGAGFVTDSFIEGDVDFMWGTGPVFIQNSELKAATSGGYYTQIRNPTGQAGFVFLNDRLTSEQGVTGTYLSRIDPNVFPYSEVVYINSAMDAQVIPEAWLLNNATTAPNVQFWEYKSTDLTGAPLDVSQRAPFSRQLTSQEAAQWSDPAFVLGGWVPYTVNVTASAAQVSTTLIVDWSAAAGHSAVDAIRIYRAGDPDDSSIFSQPIGTANTGRLKFPLPATPGSYEFRLFRNGDSIPIAASALVTVQLPRWMLRLAVLCFIAAALYGQDTRAVTEPSFPSVCTQLDAQLTSGTGGLPFASETMFDTIRMQSAMDLCAPGQAVELRPALQNNAFLIAPIRIPRGVTLLVDAGVTVFASRNPRDYDANASKACGTITGTSSGCVPLISANRSDGGGIMGYGVIDGRGHLPLLIDHAPSDFTWWDLANTANLRSLNQNNPRMIQVSNTDNFTPYKITLMNSPNFHVALGTDTNFTAWGVKIVTPYDARNTDGIDPGYSSNVTITNSYISDGDDDVAVAGITAPARVTSALRITISATDTAPRMAATRWRE